MRTRQGLETGRRAGGEISGGRRRKRAAYDVGIDEARHDEFAWLQVYEGVVVHAMVGDDVGQAGWVDVGVDPEDVTVTADGDQAPCEGEIGREGLWVDDWPRVDGGHRGKYKMDIIEFPPVLFVRSPRPSCPPSAARSPPPPSAPRPIPPPFPPPSPPLFAPVPPPSILVVPLAPPPQNAGSSPTSSGGECMMANATSTYKPNPTKMPGHLRQAPLWVAR